MIALLIIDMQKGFDDSSWGTRDNPACEKNILALLAAFREKKKPVYHVRHASTNPNSPLSALKQSFMFKKGLEPIEGEGIVTKNVNSAFIDTFLDETLQNDGIDELIVVGLTTDHCVSTTARMAANLGYKVFIPHDATATFNRGSYPADVIHDVELKILSGEFATISATKALIDKL